MRLIEREQPVLIGGETEEVALFFHPLDRRALRPAAHIVFAKGGFVLGVIGLVAHGIPAGIAVEIDVAIIGHPLPDFLAGAMVLFFGGADKTVKRNIQPLIHLLEALRIARRHFHRLQPFGFCGLNHLQNLLVGAGHKEHVLAVEPLKARQRVGRDRLIGVTDMRHAVGIGDRGGDVEGVFSWRRCCFRSGRRRSFRDFWRDRLCRRGLSFFRRDGDFFGLGLFRRSLWRLLCGLLDRFLRRLFGGFLDGFLYGFFCCLLRLLLGLLGGTTLRTGARRFVAGFCLFRLSFLDGFFRSLRHTNSFTDQIKRSGF